MFIFFLIQCDFHKVAVGSFAAQRSKVQRRLKEKLKKIKTWEGGYVLKVC